MAHQEKLKAIQDSIAAAGHSWQAGYNKFSDMSENEKKMHLGYTPGPDDPALEEQESIGAANFEAYRSSDAAGAIGAPAAFDWRNNGGQNYVTPVKNQGSCGSCVAFSTAAVVESMIKIQRGAGYPIDLSEAHLFYCIARSQGRTCSTGWWCEPALIAFRDIGVADEVCYPYVGGDQNCTGLCADWASRVNKITGYTHLISVADMKDWISTKGPLAAAFTVYEDFYSYSSGIYRHSAGNIVGGAAICIVGYDDVQSCWICKNQWTTAWGENGFFRIAYGQCGIEGNVYGVNGVINNYWINNKKVIGLWAYNGERNVWVYLTDIGWRKISPNNDDGFINMVTELTAAKAAGANVNVYIEGGVISTVYVF